MSPTPALGYWFDIKMIDCESDTGSGRSRTEFTTAKVVVLAAMQTARVKKTVAVKQGDCGVFYIAKQVVQGFVLSFPLIRAMGQSGSIPV